MDRPAKVSRQGGAPVKEGVDAWGLVWEGGGGVGYQFGVGDSFIGRRQGQFYGGKKQCGGGTPGKRVPRARERGVVPFFRKGIFNARDGRKRRRQAD